MRFVERAVGAPHRATHALDVISSGKPLEPAFRRGPRPASNLHQQLITGRGV
jgi:hypothetical protein